MRLTKPIDILIASTVAVALVCVPAYSFNSADSKVIFANSCAQEKPLRLHVLAASDRPFDQNVKLAVRDRVLDYLENALKGCESKEAAMDAVAARLPQIEMVCNTCLDHCGADYGAVATLETADFPEISYDGAVFAAGEYDALRIVLGDGSGHNWWCVLFPPLCFVDMAAAADDEAVIAAWADMNDDDREATPVRYKVSWKIADILRDQ